MPKLIDRLVINEEYQSALRPLSDDELRKLKNGVMSEDGFLSPILYHLSESGEEVIVDGHHRYEIWKEHKEELQPDYILSKEVVELSGANKKEVIKWIHRNQEGRRNDPTLREQYEMGKEVLDVREAGSTIKEYAEANDVTPSQAGHAAKLAEAIDEGEEESPGFRDQILGDETASASGAIQAVKDLNATEPSPLMVFESVQGLIGKLSRAIGKAKQAFPDLPDCGTIEAVNSLSSNVKQWEDNCSMEVK